MNELDGQYDDFMSSSFTEKSEVSLPSDDIQFPRPLVISGIRIHPLTIQERKKGMRCVCDEKLG